MKTKFKFLTSNYPNSDDLHIAYMNGITHYQQGHEVSYNPYLNDDMCDAWLNGWRWSHLINSMEMLSKQNETV